MNADNWKTISWESPSNIALVKYWGKYGSQLPMNPSPSMTLSRAVTRLDFQYRPAKDEIPVFEFYFEGKPRPDFGERMQRYLQKMEKEIHVLGRMDIRIQTSNTFPHSAGIASSASSMSALALALATLEQEHSPSAPGHTFLQRASYLARLASGSASRSVFPGWSVWGETPAVEGSSDEYAVPLTGGIHPHFMQMRDAVLIVHSGKKAVSSSAGHAVMESHPFRAARIEQARANLVRLLGYMNTGDMPGFISLVEQEALTLHGLMMSSDPGFFLLHANTLKIIERIRKTREQKGWNICFTLDAGPNIHLLYPEPGSEQIQAFIRKELLPLCEGQQWMDDMIGAGPVKLQD